MNQSISELYLQRMRMIDIKEYSRIYCLPPNLPVTLVHYSYNNIRYSYLAAAFFDEKQARNYVMKELPRIDGDCTVSFIKANLGDLFNNTVKLHSDDVILDEPDYHRAKIWLEKLLTH